MRDFTVLCLSEAVSPISHASGSVGNEQVIAKEAVTTPRGTRWVPMLSGNALRHRCIREPGVLHMIDLWGLRGKLTKLQLNFLLHGGNLTESTAGEDTARLAEFNRLFPLLKLCGGCLPNQILKGSMHAWRGALICEENRAYMQAILPADWIPTARLQSCERMIGNWQYTRGDGGKEDIAIPGATDAESSLMIFAGQAVNRGSVFLHGFQLNHVTELELGALLLSIEMWQESGGTIGGQSARGHGRLKTSVNVDVEPDVMQFAVEAYERHLTENKDSCIAWLNTQFSPIKEPKPAKGKKAKTLLGDES